MPIRNVKVLKGTYKLNAIPVDVTANYNSGSAMLQPLEYADLANCVLGACEANGTGVLTSFYWTRTNNDVWEVRSDGFYVNGTKKISVGNTRTFFILRQLSNTQMEVLAMTPLMDGMGYVNGINFGGYHFGNSLNGWGCIIQANYITGDHTLHLFCNGQSDNQTRYYPTTRPSAGSYQFTLMDSESYESKPEGYNSATDPIGGTGENYFEGDGITIPTNPDETISGALGYGFLNIYAPTASQLRAFGALLWTNAFNTKWYDLDSISNLVLNAVSDPINFIVGLFMIPVTPAKTGSSGIFLGGINANTVTADRVSSQFKTISFGTMQIEELYGNYLDYSNSRVSIYLPYIGTADIDIQEINGGSIELNYIIDCFTGACVANVKCTKSTKTPWGLTYKNETVHSYSGNVAIQLPISAGSFDTMLQGLVNIGLGLGTNTPAIAMQGGKDTISGFAGDVTTRGSLSSNTGKLCYQTPYLMFTRPIETRPAKLGSLHGYSAGVGGKLSTFSGYVECSDVKLDGVNATDTELAMIETLLKGGVYI